MSTSPPTHELTTDPVLDGIKQAITRQRLPPGTKLNEESLASIFGVSRTRIRAALQRLQHSGLVTSAHKQIARVAQPSVKQARDMFAVRRLIEPSVAAEVARIKGSAGLKKLYAMVEAEHEARERGDRLEAVRLAGEFHVVLAELSGNEVVSTLMRQIIDRTFLVIFMYQSPASVSCVHDEHMRLLNAIAAGDAPLASEAMLDHVRLIEGRMNLQERYEQPVDLRKAFEGIAQLRP